MKRAFADEPAGDFRDKKSVSNLYAQTVRELGTNQCTCYGRSALDKEHQTLSRFGKAPTAVPVKNLIHHHLRLVLHFSHHAVRPHGAVKRQPRRIRGEHVPHVPVKTMDSPREAVYANDFFTGVRHVRAA